VVLKPVEGATTVVIKLELKDSLGLVKASWEVGLVEDFSIIAGSYSFSS
jgi:hypothetical protein